MSEFHHIDWCDSVGQYGDIDCDCPETERETRILKTYFASLGAQWDKLEVFVKWHFPGKGFGVQADGPGWVAWVGNEDRIISAWSHGDPELGAGYDLEPSATRAVQKLVEMIQGGKRAD